jgi:hypothetical protein
MSRNCVVYRLVLAAAAISATPAFAELIVQSTSPTRNASNVSPLATVSVTFDRPVMTATFTSQTFWAFGRSSGTAVGALSFSNSNQTVTLTPTRRFQVGEMVTVFLADSLRAADGTFLRTQGYSWQFMTRARCAGLNFQQLDSMSNFDETQSQTRIYGGITTDFTNDGWVDIATINEVSADMRLFVNRADGSGLYDDWLRPPLGLRDEVSPNEPGDFNRDGNADFAVASTFTSTLCIALGNGDGTFDPPQFLNTPNSPHGVGVLDVDGDGDTDIAVSCSGGNVVALYLNNGSGVFSGPTNIESGGDGEYGLIAADMNNDGILDLVVGARDSQDAVILRCNGNGTFTTTEVEDIGGSVWVIVAGDLNNDGNIDIASANSFSANGAILFGDGTGHFNPATTYPSTGHTASSDIGDVDGDGDLDWILSAFGGENWRLFTNNGNGVFTFHSDITAPSNPSCAAFLDCDNDGDLDLALFDEIADVVVILRNTATRAPGDINLDGIVDLGDLTLLLSGFGSSGGALEDGDINHDNVVDLTDLSLLLSSFGQGC